jgi:hypothetical protein
MSMLEDSRLDLIDDGRAVITSFLIKALKEINPAVPTVLA